jgi:hypothetical protein
VVARDSVKAVASSDRVALAASRLGRIVEIAPDPVHQVDRDGNAALDEGVQELILKHPGSTDGWAVPSIQS